MAKVLVVEDEPGIALGLEDTLRLEGYQVEVVTNGASASRRLLEETFDLILLEVMLPGKSGFEVCRELRQSGLEAPITEAGNSSQAEFSESRLLKVVQENRHLGASQLCAAVLDDVKHFSRGCNQTDDLTVVVAKFLAEG